MAIVATTAATRYGSGVDVATWYMVKRLDTGEVHGHDMYFYGTYTGREVIGDVEVQRHRDGRPHHLIVHVDAGDETDAILMASACFDIWHEREAAS